MPTRGSKDPNGRALRGRRAHTTFALLTDPARQIWNSFNNRANAGSADAPEAAVNGCLYDRFKSLYTKTATKPSLVIVPARFKSGTLYSQIPSSNADFTVTRNTAARRFDSAGLIESVASGIPRLDYYTSGGVTGCPALLVEPAGTNLVFHSEQFTTANSYLLRQSTVTNNVTGTLDPAGGNTADQIFPDNSTNLHQILSNDSPNGITFASGTTYTQSVFAKAGSGSQGQRLQSTFSSSRFTGLPFANFNLASGTVTSTGGGATASIQSMGNGWYRCITTAVCNSSGTGGGFFAGLITADNSAREQSFLGIDTHFIYAWGGQMETGSVATSYIPTTAGTGSRSADVISVSGAVSGSIGQTEGTIYMEVAVYSANKELFSISSGGVNGEAIRIQTNSDGKLGAIALVSNSQVITTSSINALNLGQFYKVAFAYKLNDYTLYIDGVVQTLTDVTGGVPVNMNKLAFARPNDSFIQDQRVRAAALYTTRLTNAELAFITQP